MAKRPTNRRYPDEFKADAVALLRSSGKPIAQVAEELGVTDTSLGSSAPGKRLGLRKRRKELESAAAEEVEPGPKPSLRSELPARPAPGQNAQTRWPITSGPSGPLRRTPHRAR